jgi:hypothetical protein
MPSPYGPAAALHKTLGAGVDVCQISGRRAQIVNRSATTIWWRNDGTDPVALADGAMYLPGLSTDVIVWPAETWTGTGSVKVIGTNGGDYTVQVDWSQAH